MARRKRKEESPDWVAPEFDEVGYMRQEMGAARASVATIVWAIVGAGVSFLLFAVYPPLAFVGGLAMGFGLYFMLPLFGIRINAFKRRDWFGHGMIYFFSWLAFWIIMLNPPIGDFADPTINAISVSPYHPGLAGGLACVPPSAGSVSFSTLGPLNSSFYILFRASDNVGIATLRVHVTPLASTAPAYDANATLATGNNPCQGHETESLLGGTYVVVVPLPISESRIRIDIIAADPSGRQVASTFQISLT